MPEKTTIIIQAIIIICAVFLLVAAFVIAYMLYFKSRKAKMLMEKETMVIEFEKQLLQSQVEVQENTYSVLSKELHDNIGQLLGTAKMLLGVTERKMENPPETLLQANASISKAITDLRSISKSLDKDWLQQFNFHQNLSDEIARINSGKMIQATLDQSCELYMNAGEQLILFRIVQEAMQNAIKHAMPKHIFVKISEDKNTLQIIVQDNGKGFIQKEIPTGMGLKNMEQRARILRGNIKWDSNDNGTLLTITIPQQITL